jgi:hypothetical protein
MKISFRELDERGRGLWGVRFSFDRLVYWIWFEVDDDR